MPGKTDGAGGAALAARVLGRAVAPEDASALAAAANDPAVVAAVLDELQKMAHKQQLKGCVVPQPCYVRVSVY